MFPLSRVALQVATSTPVGAAALNAATSSAVIGLRQVAKAALHATAVAPAVATKVTTTASHTCASSADPAVLDEAWTMAASSILGTGRGLHTSTVAHELPQSTLEMEDPNDSAAKLRKRAELYSKTEAGTAAWRADTMPSTGSVHHSATSSDTMAVPDEQHRGVGVVDEGVDGLREAGFLNDQEARELTSDDAVRRHAGLAPPPGSVDGATNVYAVDDQYKEIAFAILENTERDFSSSLHPKPEALNPAAHDQTIAASSFAEMSAEVNPNVTEDLVHTPDTSHLSPAARMHASTLYATHVSYSWRPNPVPVDQGAPEVPPASMTSSQLRALARDPSAFVPGSRRAMHTSAVPMQPLVATSSNLTAATAVAVSACMRRDQSNALVAGLPIGARPYTYITGWSEFMEELDRGHPALHYEALRVALSKSSAMYTAEDAPNQGAQPQQCQQQTTQKAATC